MYLIDDKDRDVELFRHLAQFAEMLAKLALSLVQFSATVEVIAEMRHDAVDDQETVLARGKWLGKTAQLLVLILAVLGTDIEDVLVRCI